MIENERMLLDLKESTVPFTYRFLGLRLRLAFTKRRFQRVEKSYHAHLLTDRGRLNDLVNVLQSSFSSLRDEIERIEQGQESMKQRTLPKVKEQLTLHQGFFTFLAGFREVPATATTNDTVPACKNKEKKRCHLHILNQGCETTTAFKRLIAEFAGVPTGMLLHDLRTLENLLAQDTDSVEPSLISDGDDSIENRILSR
jgi:hypothetical protein